MKRIGLKILEGVLVTIILLQFNCVMAVSQKDLDNVNSEIENKKEELEDVQNQKSQTMSEVEDLTTKISDYQAQIDDLDSQINELNSKIEESQRKVDEAQAKYDENKKLAEERLVVMQESGDTTYLDFILSSKSITDLISSYYLASELAEADTELLNSLEQERQELENAKTELENNKSELDNTKRTKESASSQLQVLKSAKNKQVEQLSQDEKDIQAQIDELVDHESSIRSEIARMKAEYDKKKPGNGNSNNSNSGGTNSNNETSSFGFGWPVSNNRIGTGYGASGSYWSSGYHTGVDFPVGSGTPVYAVGDGQVFDTGYNSAYGNFVEIYHGNNVYSFYAHASSVNVSKGQTVTKGQQIMLSGASGNVTGAHLHFEIRTPGYGYSSCVNPMPYLP